MRRRVLLAGIAAVAMGFGLEPALAGNGEGTLSYKAKGEVPEGSLATVRTIASGGTTVNKQRSVPPMTSVQTVEAGGYRLVGSTRRCTADPCGSGPLGPRRKTCELTVNVSTKQVTHVSIRFRPDEKCRMRLVEPPN